MSRAEHQGLSYTEADLRADPAARKCQLVRAREPAGWNKPYRIEFRSGIAPERA